MQSIYLPTGFSRAYLSYVWECAACEASVTSLLPCNPGDCLIFPTTPEGWREIEHRFYCPKHAIVVLVDGKIS
jgi:hypothetical protein